VEEMMKRKKIIFLVILMSSFLFLFPVNEKGEKNQEIEKEIWALEEAYVSYYFAANHRAILSMFHDQFLGWPEGVRQPVDKKAISKYLEVRYPKPRQMTYKMDRQGITFLNNIALNYYLLYITLKDERGNELKVVTRMTHTWIKTGKQWKILGGMSNSQNRKRGQAGGAPGEAGVFQWVGIPHGQSLTSSP
jgi:ketosteroid isomerase-like protein